MVNLSFDAKQWRAEAAKHLFNAGYYAEADAFAVCGSAFGTFNVVTCAEDISHNPTISPLTCKLRYCPDCEHREMARKMARYVPHIQEAAETDRPGWRLMKMNLTTPYNLEAADAPEAFQRAWAAVEQCLREVMYERLTDHLTIAEKRRGRANLKLHGVGALISAEYGEKGHKLHFHSVLWCPWLDQDKLAASWENATNGDACITWLKEITYTKVENHVAETVKYSTKFTTLEPRLVPLLADVMAGQRRVRSYGIWHGIGDIKREPCECNLCHAKMKLMHVTEYISLCEALGVNLDREIAAARGTALLNLKHGNNSGEMATAAQPGARDHPPGTVQLNLPGISGWTKYH